jgi:hypothetical protein
MTAGRAPVESTGASTGATVAGQAPVQSLGAWIGVTPSRQARGQHRPASGLHPSRPHHDTPPVGASPRPGRRRDRACRWTQLPSDALDPAQQFQRGDARPDRARSRGARAPLARSRRRTATASRSADGTIRHAPATRRRTHPPQQRGRPADAAGRSPASLTSDAGAATICGRGRFRLRRLVPDDSRRPRRAAPPREARQERAGRGPKVAATSKQTNHQQGTVRSARSPTSRRHRGVR